MKYMPKANAQKFVKSPNCTIYEFGGNHNIDGAIADISERYPESGWAMNEISHELIHVLSGSGQLVTKDSTTPLEVSDVALIEPKEQYYFEGDNLQIYLACTPAWTPEQHKNIQD